MVLCIPSSNVVFGAHFRIFLALMLLVASVSTSLGRARAFLCLLLCNDALLKRSYDSGCEINCKLVAFSCDALFVSLFILVLVFLV